MTERTRTVALAALQEARELIKGWHNMGKTGLKDVDKMWEIYDQHSPEMKRINGAIEVLKNTDPDPGLQYSDRKPDREGMWWYKNPKGQQTVVRLVRRAEERGLFFIADDNHLYPAEGILGQWAGPILEPLEEEK